MPAVPMVDSLVARLTAERLKQQGHDAAAALRRVGLQAARVQDPEGRIPFHKHAEFLELAARLTEDRCFGAHLGASVNPKQIGTVGYVALSSSRLRTAIERVCRYARVLTEGVEPRLEAAGPQAAFVSSVVDPKAVRTTQVIELGASASVAVFRALTSRNLSPARIEFRHRAPKDAREHERIYGCPVHFGKRRNAVVLSKDQMELPIKTADPTLLRILENHCSLILGKAPKQKDLLFQVRELVLNRLSDGEPAMDTVASELGMSMRTLARRLDEKGTSYRDILDDVRRQLALEYTSDRRLRLGEIAFLLGYNNQTSFNHAFRRWTGATPSEVRAN